MIWQVPTENKKILGLVSKITARDEERRKVESISTRKPVNQSKESKRKASGKRSEFIYLGWKHREDAYSPYVQVRGVGNGGGLRRIPYGDLSQAQLLQQATEIFFPGGKSPFSKVGELKSCRTELGNFAGEPFNDPEDKYDNFTLSDYLAKNGLYASRVRFYLLTTSKAKLEVQEGEPGSVSSESEPTQSSRASNESQYSVHSNADEAESTIYIYYVDDSEGKMYAEFTRITTSSYSEESSAMINSGWSQCFSARSDQFLEDNETEYHPCNDSFTVSSLTIDDRVYLERMVDPNEQSLIAQYVYPTAQERSDDSPAILHGPDEIHGYENNHLFIGVITNFHNEIGVTYEWYLNDNVILRGATHALIRIKEPGTYFCKVFYGALPLISSSVVVREKQLRKFSNKAQQLNELRSTSISVTEENKNERSVSSQTGQRVLEIPVEKLNVNWKHTIGARTFGQVFKGTWLGTDVAVKQIRRAACVKEPVLREAKIHNSLHHPNVVTFMGMSTRKKDILLVTEFVGGASLQHHIDEETVMEERLKSGLMREILKGTAYLHEVGVVHGDIKPGNILVTASLESAKLCDFGLGRLRQHASLSLASLSLGAKLIEGTPSYMAPECLVHNNKASVESDIWSLGITFLEFLTMEDAWEKVLQGVEGEEELAKLVNAQKASLVPLSYFPSLCSGHKSILQMCLRYDKKMRPTAKPLLEYQW